ncbi:MAG: DNA polymerase I [Bacteroidales bacterium]|nr:DNA polymerase I [Bacteroidales bacterium]
MKKLFLLDGMALIYRAYFAFSRNPRISSKGLNTSAILGFANTLYEVLKNENPSHIAVAFDTSVPTFRHESFEKYKANREDMPEDLSASIPYIFRLIEGFNIPVLTLPGYEADDIIGTLAKKAEKMGFEVYMMTPDKDFGQLVSDHIFIYRPAKAGEKAEILGPAEICEKYSIEKPEQLIDILGLWGDASDNIPGIPGIGEKRAKELIAGFGSIENMISNMDQLKGRIRENVEKFAAQGLQSKDLATIRIDSPIELEVEKLKTEAPDPERLRPLLDELEFRTFARRLFGDLKGEEGAGQSGAAPLQHELFSSGEDTAPPANGKMTFDPDKVNYFLTGTPEKRKELIKKLQSCEEFCFDTETTGLDPNNAELVGISFCIRPGEAFFVPLPENYQDCLSVVQEFREVFENEKIAKTGQNIKYDISMLKWYDVEVKGYLFDTMLAHYLIQPDMRHNMDLLAETYLNYSPIPIEALIGKKGKEQSGMRSVEPNLLKDYACEDADVTLQLKKVFMPMLAESGSMDLFDNIEMPLVPVLSKMEAEGVKLDIGALQDYSIQLETEIAELETDIHALAGVKFNIASPKQLGEILFEKLKIAEKPRMTKTKQYSTGEDILQKLMNKHEIVARILDFRSLSKLKSTYVDVLPDMVNPRTGRLHTSYNQAVAATGRLSSNNPNLQNIPIRTEKGREIRKAFVPRNENFVLFSADYSQIELRIMAHISGDEAMIEAFSNNLDIHTATAARVYGITPGEVTPEMRRNAKTVNFGIIYGISAFGLSERLNIPRGEAKDIIDQYFAQYPGIRNYMNQTIRFAKTNGFVTTLKGRRRYLRDINSSNNVVRGFAERNAINAPIQGSSADMIKIAMIDIHRKLNTANLKTSMILQVHDELVFDVYRDELETVREIVSRSMVAAIPLKVPVVVDMNTGNNWLEAH